MNYSTILLTLSSIHLSIDLHSSPILADLENAIPSNLPSYISEVASEQLRFLTGSDYAARLSLNYAYTGTELLNELNFFGLTKAHAPHRGSYVYENQIYTYKDSPVFKTFVYVDQLYGNGVGPDTPAIAALRQEIYENSQEYYELNRSEDDRVLDLLINPTMADIGLKTADNFATDYSNLYNHEGRLVDINRFSERELITFKSDIKLENVYKFERLERVRSIYHASIPTGKLKYPEPYIASPTYIHSDIGYIHILLYQYWLWFIFVFLIIFFFITFLCTVRWCSMRVQPRRETRGVSRSKCGDLITASVPITWALSIIVSETTDALDYYDGFGTSEVMVGVRAYQWGWEYYYPKDIDLNYNVRPSYSTFIGNSVKYATAGEKMLTHNNVWKFYQNKKTDEVVTPAHLLLLPLDNNKRLNFTNFDDIGAAHSKNSHAFSTIRANSKTFNTNLVHTPSNLTSKYVLLNQLHTNENSFTESLNYGLKRQHALTTAEATTNTYASFLDKKSMNQMLQSNLNYFDASDTISRQTRPTSVYEKTNPINLNDETSQFASTFDLNQQSSTRPFQSLLQDSPATLTAFNDNSDKKQFSYPIRKLFNSKQLVNNQTDGSSDLLQPVKAHLPVVVTADVSANHDASADNAAVLSGDRSVRTYEKLSSNKGHMNFNPNLNTIVAELDQTINKRATGSLLNYFYLINTNWSDTSTYTRLMGNRSYFSAPYAPVKTSFPYLADIDYDSTASYKGAMRYEGSNVSLKLRETKSDDVDLLQGPRENAPVATMSSYWDTFWAHSSLDLRLKTNIDASVRNDLGYLPMFANYSDYDFRNDQAIELLEDAFWETSYSGYNHYDYMMINQNTKKEQGTTKSLWKIDDRFYKANLDLELKSGALTSPVIKDLSSTGQFYANALQADDLISPSSAMLKKDFFQFAVSSSLDSIDESYAHIKEFNNFFNTANYSSLGNFGAFQNPLSYINVLNVFRADFSEFTTHTDLTTTTSPLSLLEQQSGDVLLDTNDANVNTGSLRFSDPIALRSTAKNSMTTYNALQKVFRARFDEGRSLTGLRQFSELGTKQPFITDDKVPYTKLLGKNRESFYNTTFYNSNVSKLINFTTSPTNVYFFEFPLLTAMESDVARHLWFDWFVKWSKVTVQPASSAKYSTLGVPFSRKHFDFSPASGESINDNETYFIKLTRARKNYLNNWMYSPYLLLRNGEWYKDSLITNMLSMPTAVTTVEQSLNSMSWYWKSLAYSSNTTKTFSASNSGQNVYLKSTWRPLAGVQSYYYNVNNLVDILTRREYIYRQYFEVNHKLIHLPTVLTAGPQNPLINELKSTFLFVDPTTYTSEYSREVFYHSLAFFKFIIFKDMLVQLARTANYLPINWELCTEYLFFYFLTPNSAKSNNLELYKNQHRPLRKGLNSMLRLHGTGAVAMPTEIRLQILASSKDVIHSWAIPSAGIKIDCIPGYTSHRIMMFLVSGIYWGQCMEICGRYHHWMPIVAYFMKRDLFFLWCTHFVFQSASSGLTDMNDKQYADYIRFVSYDKASWLTELVTNH